jgi:hypothetical protein
VIITDPDMAMVYARALVAARGDHQITTEEAAALRVRIAARCGEELAFEDVLLAPGLAKLRHFASALGMSAEDLRRVT